MEFALSKDKVHFDITDGIYLKDLVPMKKDVINGLVPALDDHKRLVRQAATSARNSWSIST